MSTIKRKERIAAAVKKCVDTSGCITAEAVVEAARNPKNPLHGEFEWDVGLAAQEAWLMRARELIREVRLIVIYGERRLAVPVYIANPQADENGYIRTAKVAKNSALKWRALEAEVARIRAAIHRALGLAVAFDLESDFEEMLERIVAIETRLSGGSSDAGDDARPQA